MADDAKWKEPSEAELNQVPGRERRPSTQQQGRNGNQRRGGNGQGNGRSRGNSYQSQADDSQGNSQDGRNSRQGGHNRGNGRGGRGRRRRQSQAQAAQGPNTPSQQNGGLAVRGRGGKSGMPVAQRLDASPNNAPLTTWQAHAQAAPRWDPIQHKANLKLKAGAHLLSAQPDAGHVTAGEQAQAEERSGSQDGLEQGQIDQAEDSHEDGPLPTTSSKVPLDNVELETQQSQPVGSENDDIAPQEASESDPDHQSALDTQGLGTDPAQTKSPRSFKSPTPPKALQGANLDAGTSIVATSDPDLPDYKSDDQEVKDLQARGRSNKPADTVNIGSKVDWADEVERSAKDSTTIVEQIAPPPRHDASSPVEHEYTRSEQVGDPASPHRFSEGAKPNAPVPGAGAQAGARGTAGGMFGTPDSAFQAQQPHLSSLETKTRPKDSTGGRFGIPADAFRAHQPHEHGAGAQPEPQRRAGGLFEGLSSMFGGPPINGAGFGAQTGSDRTFGEPFVMPGGRPTKKPYGPSGRATGNHLDTTQAQFPNPQQNHNFNAHASPFGNPNAGSGYQFPNHPGPQNRGFGQRFGQGFDTGANGQGGAGRFPRPNPDRAPNGGFGFGRGNQAPGFGGHDGAFRGQFPGFAGPQSRTFANGFDSNGGHHRRDPVFPEDFMNKFEQDTQSPQGQSSADFFPDGTPRGNMKYRKDGPRNDPDFIPGDRSRRGSDIVSVQSSYDYPEYNNDKEPEVEEPQKDFDDRHDRPASQLAISYHKHEQDDENKEQDQKLYSDEEDNFDTPRPGQYQVRRQDVPVQSSRPSPWLAIILLFGILISLLSVVIFCAASHGMAPIPSSGTGLAFAPHGTFQHTLNNHEDHIRNLHSRMTSIEVATNHPSTSTLLPTTSFEDATRNYFSSFLDLAVYGNLFALRANAQRKASAGVDSTYTHLLNLPANANVNANQNASSRNDMRAHANYIGQWLNAYFTTRRRRDQRASDLSTHISVSQFEHAWNTRLLLNYTLPAMARGADAQPLGRKYANRICNAKTWNFFCADPPEKVRRDSLLAFFEGWNNGFAKLLVRARYARTESVRHVEATLKVMNATDGLEYGTNLYTSPDFSMGDVRRLLVGLGNSSKSFAVATKMSMEEQHESQTAFRVALANGLTEGKILDGLVVFLERADRNLEGLLAFLRDDTWGLRLAEFWTAKYELQIEALVRRTLECDGDCGLDGKYSQFYAAYASYGREAMLKDEKVPE